jgi:predicted transposase YdaD
VIKDTEFRLDGLLTPLSDDPYLPLIFLEAQMQRDTQFYGRYFAEIFLYPTFSRLFRTKNNICGRKHQETAKLDSVYRRV